MSKVDLISQLQQLENTPGNNDKIMLLFLELLQFYKSELNKSKDLKSQSAAEKAKLDSLYLTLQNLNYEIDYLNREIQKYDSIEYSYQNLELKPLDEFLMTFTHVDDHSTMIARLQDELQERKSMQKELESAREERNKFNETLNSKKGELETMNKDLDELIQFTLPIQERHGLTFTKDINNNQHAEQLPFPLYCLYQHIVGYNSAYTDLVNVEICGGTNDSGNYKPDPTNFYDKHPLHLKVTFNPQISLVFKYLPVLDIVVVETLVSVRSLHPDFLTSNLYPGDDGQSSPNPSNAFLDDGNFTFSSELAGGSAYTWAQIISGLHYPTHLQLNLSKNNALVDNKPVISEISKLLLERKAKMDSMSVAFESLVQGKIKMKGKISGFQLVVLA
ncbi:THO complex subunit 5 [Boothiomyces sp. JEL0866]|nr:THO complex subunit 5 [Boothiomyces sp. JEL0866]